MYRTLLATCLCWIALSGCGEGSENQAGPKRLPAGAQSTVDRSQATIRSYCRHVGLALAGRREPPGAADYERAREAVDALVAIGRKAPGAQSRNQGTMRQVIGDSAENLEGTNCSRGLVRALDEGLRSLPQP